MFQWWRTGLVICLIMILLIAVYCIPQIIGADCLDVYVSQTDYRPINNMQSEASVWLTAFDHKLYFYYKKQSVWDFSGFGNYLCAFENGSISRIHQIDGGVFAIQNGVVYYDSRTNDPFAHCVMAYDIASGTEMIVGSFSSNSLDSIAPSDCFYDADGTIYIGFGMNPAQYFLLNGTTLEKTDELSKVYDYEDSKFVVSRNGLRKVNIVCYGNDGQKQSYSGALAEGRKSVIPTKNGLIIHNEMYEDLLYYIDGTTRKASLLYSVDCEHSTSAVNVHGEYVFLSFKGFEDYDALLSGSAGDAARGTYRISLRGLSVERISDRFYSGLYIFDDTGIYACDDDCNIYKLDFDGNVIMTLLEH